MGFQMSICKLLMTNISALETTLNPLQISREVSAAQWEEARLTV